MWLEEGVGDGRGDRLPERVAVGDAEGGVAERRVVAVRLDPAERLSVTVVVQEYGAVAVRVRPGERLREAVGVCEAAVSVARCEAEGVGLADGLRVGDGGEGVKVLVGSEVAVLVGVRVTVKVRDVRVANDLVRGHDCVGERTVVLEAVALAEGVATRLGDAVMVQVRTAVRVSVRSGVRDRVAVGVAVRVGTTESVAEEGV